MIENAGMRIMLRLLCIILCLLILIVLFSFGLWLQKNKEKILDINMFELTFCSFFAIGTATGRV